MPTQTESGALTSEPYTAGGVGMCEPPPPTSLVVSMKKISSTRLTSISGIISTSESSSSRRRFQVKPVSTGSIGSTLLSTAASGSAGFGT